MDDNKRIAYFQKKLMDRLKEDSSDSSSNKNTDRDGGSNDDVDSREMDIAVKEIVDERLIKVREALKRIEDGEYGICLECGKKIEDGRLDAIPEVTCCIECQTIKERSDQTATDLRTTLFPDQIG